MRARRDQALPGAGRRRQDHVGAADQLDQRLLLRGVERQPLLGHPGLEDVEQHVRVGRFRRRGEAVEERQDACSQTPSRCGSGLRARKVNAVVDADRDRPEPDRLQPGDERGGIDRVVDVADVEVVQAGARQAVRADHRPARPQHPQRLREHLVLQGRRRHVVQHREGPDGVERRRRRTAALVASPCCTSTLVPAKRSRSVATVSSSSSTATSCSTRWRSHSALAPGPGPISSIRGPSSRPSHERRQHVVVQVRRPLGTRAELGVVLVHRHGGHPRREAAQRLPASSTQSTAHGSASSRPSGIGRPHTSHRP